MLTFISILIVIFLVALVLWALNQQADAEEEEEDEYYNQYEDNFYP